MSTWPWWLFGRRGPGERERGVSGAGTREGKARTVILSTHILPEVEAICQRVIIMHRGKKALDAPLAELQRGGASLEEIFARTTAREVVVPLDATPEARP